jgi:hypothetical protein
MDAWHQVLARIAGVTPRGGALEFDPLPRVTGAGTYTETVPISPAPDLPVIAGWVSSTGASPAKPYPPDPLTCIGASPGATGELRPLGTIWRGSVFAALATSLQASPRTVNHALEDRWRWRGDGPYEGEAMAPVRFEAPLEGGVTAAREQVRKSGDPLAVLLAIDFEEGLYFFIRCLIEDIVECPHCPEDLRRV